MNSPLISIIVPVYDAEPYLCQCVDSILAQSYSNLEVILVDDGSPDGCPAICDEYAAKDRRVVVIHQPNAGFCAARNAGLDVAKGEYIGFVDDDDWIEPNTCEILYDIIKTSDTDIAISFYIWEDIPPKKDSSDYIILSDTEAITKMLYFRCGFTSVLGKLFTRRVVDNIRFPVGIANCEDLLFLTEALANSKKLSYGDHLCYHYRIRANSASHKFKESHWSSLDAVDRIFDIIKEHDKTLIELAAKSVLEHEIALSKTAEANRMFSKAAYQKLLAHIKKYIHKDSWNLLSHREQCWLALLLCGRIPFIAGCKVWKKLRRLKAAS